MTKDVQAKNIPDALALSRVAVLAATGDVRSASLDDLAEVLDFPWKVVAAKCRALVKRGLLDGCACGCRGDFVVTEAGCELLRAAA